MKKEIKTNKAQSAPGLLSQAILVGDFLFSAGFIHITHDGTLVDGSVENRFRQVMKNIEEVLSAAKMNFDNVVKVTLYVTDIAILPELNKVYTTYFHAPMPAREAVCVSKLPLSASIEMSVIARKSKRE